jgi:hypothetical protein
MTKGVINENIIDMLNLRPLDEILKEKGVDNDTQAETEAEPPDVEMQQSVAALRDLTAKQALLEGTDHAEAMDDLHDEILQHARDMMVYGFNIDHPRARGIFEIAATLYGHAINTKNAKRDAQLKSLKLTLDKKRVELEEKRTIHIVGGTGNTQGSNNEDSILVEDRNELLRRLRQQITEPQ